MLSYTYVHMAEVHLILSAFFIINFLYRKLIYYVIIINLFMLGELLKFYSGTNLNRFCSIEN